MTGCSRRHFLGCAAAVLPLAARTAAAQRASPGRAIDVHAHYFPMEYLEALAGTAGAPGFSVDLTAAAGPTLVGGGATTVLDVTYWDLERRIAAMDAAGVTVHALSLTMPMVHVATPERGAEFARLVNDAMLAAHARHPGRFVACAALPLQDPSRAVAELDRVGKAPGLRAVYFPTHVAGKELSDRSLDPVYDRCEALGLPIMLHPHPAVVGLDRLQHYYLPNLLGNPFDTAIAASYLVFGGVLDRFPRLTVVLPHSGGAMPILYGRLEKGQQVIPDLKNAAARPFREYLRRFYYDTITHAPDALRYLVELVGADRVVLGSDYCFNMGYDRPREIVSALSIAPADRDRIFFGNAQALLRL